MSNAQTHVCLGNVEYDCSAVGQQCRWPLIVWCPGWRESGNPTVRRPRLPPLPAGWHRIQLDRFSQPLVAYEFTYLPHADGREVMGTLMSVLKYDRGGRSVVQSLVLALSVLTLPGMFKCNAAEAPAPPAPRWRFVPIDKNVWTPTKVQKDYLTVKGILLGGKLDTPQTALLENYYNGYALARWTHESNRAELVRFRKILHGDFATAYRATSKAAHSRLNNDIVLKFMAAVAKPYADKNFHRAVRVNAMLTIGRLSEVPRSVTTPPTPLPAALPVLQQTVADPAQLDAVKVEAMVGIIRHAGLGGIRSPAQQPALVTTITQQMVAMVNAPPASGPGADGKEWMRRQAAEVLGEMGVASGPITAALTGMAGNTALKHSARCPAARALGKLTYAGTTGLNPSNLSAPLGELAIEVWQVEEETTAVSRRRLQSHLKDLSVGLTGINGLATTAGAPHAAFVSSVRTPVSNMLRQLSNKTIKTDQDLRAKIKPEADKIPAALAKKPGP